MTNRTTWGHFFLLMIYSKLPTSIKEQLAILKNRGMAIPDIEHAADFLTYCSYYRFCGFALAYEEFSEDGERTHIYRPGTNFSDVENIYHFDGELRRLLFHYITLIEIDFRNTFCNESALFYNTAHWFMDPKNFISSNSYNNFIKLCHDEVDRSKEVFIRSYKRKYDDPKLPPIWMLAELMSFSCWSKAYQNLSDTTLQKRIASIQQIPEKYLISWLQTLTVLRNMCAHHSRIWNRNFYQAPLLSSRISKKVSIGQHKKIITLLLIIDDMLKKINRSDDFRADLFSLFNKYPTIDITKMGIHGHLPLLFE